MVVLVGFLPIGFSLFIDTETLREDYLTWNSVYSGYILVLGVRAIFHLRVITQIRKLNLIILKVFKAALPILALLLVIILIITSVEVNISKSIMGNATFRGDFKEFLDTASQVYEVVFNNWGDPSDYPVNIYAIYYIKTIIFPAVMFNILIATVFKVFQDYYKEK